MVQELYELIKGFSGELRELSDFIHANPELGYEEYKASEKIAQLLKKHGFSVERGYAGVQTALRGNFYCNETAETPVVCIPGEYDALAGLGHGCGHNLIAAASSGAALAAAAYAKKHGIALKLCFMGTPAEEGKGGKVLLIKNGGFKGIDMAVMAHPSSFTSTDPGSLGVARAYIRFHGKAAHAGGSPHLGINALDAMVHFYSDMLIWKADLAPRERVHGIITKGGDAANIIPDFTEAFFYVRAPESAGLPELQRKLEHSAQVGAEKTGCKVEVEWVSAYQPTKINRALNMRYYEDWKKLGQEIKICNGNESCGSTDMGDVTQIVPGAHFYFSLSNETRCAGHSIEFREAAAADAGFESALKAAAAMAEIVLAYSTDAEFRSAVKKDFA